jgi:hypothetical protein
MSANKDVVLLFGGGLDSLLVREWSVRAGLRPLCLHFDTGFVTDHRREVVADLARRAGADAVRVVDVFEDYLRQVVLRPKHGYGAAMNPCLDCRIDMLRRAGRVAASEGLEILVTGEVVGQRAHDQSRHAFRAAERESGVEGRVLRPLSAGPAGPAAERLGPVAEPSSDAPGCHGSTRRRQFDLARRYGVERYPTPDGRCCKLADPAFAARLRDLLAHRDAGDVGREDVERLSRGRHFRVAWDLKLIVARDEAESVWLDAHRGRAWSVRATAAAGPVALLEGDLRDETLPVAGSIVARYAAAHGRPQVELTLRRGDEQRRLRCAPARAEQLARSRI